jgi:hypothetical protein
MKRFVRAVTKPLQNQAEMMNSVAPQEFALYLSKTAHVSLLDMAIVGFENGKTNWAVTRFFATKIKGRISIAPQAELRGTDAGTTTIMNGAGYWAPAAEYVKANLLDFYAKPEKVITQALEKAASDDVHKGVGGPYAILHIGVFGHTWVQQGECKLD